MRVTEGVLGAELAPWDENKEKLRGLNDYGASVFASGLLCSWPLSVDQVSFGENSHQFGVGK